jgi:hypothetical protein
LGGQGWSPEEFEYIRVALVEVEPEDPGEASRVLERDYCDKSEKIAKYLTTLKRPKGMSRSAFQSFLKGALKYTIAEN